MRRQVYALEDTEKHSNKLKERCFLKTYYEVNCRENSNRPIPSPISIGQDGSDEGREIASALPSGDIPRCVDVPFVQLLRKVRNQISGNTIVRQALATLGTCIYTNTAT